MAVVRQITGELGSSTRVKSLRHPLPALPARGDQADEAGGEKSEGTGWEAPPGRMPPGSGMCGG
jgi:hypothetical protein